MSKKLLTFLLSEIGLVRIRCLKCQRVAEVRCDQLAGTFEFAARCPFCAEEFSISQDNPFRLLAKAIDSLKQHTRQMELEFVLAEEPQTIPAR